MDTKNAHILVIDDDKDVLHTARIVLKPIAKQITTESNPQQLNYLVTHNNYDVILLDMNYTAGATSGKEGLFWLRQLLEIKPQQQVVMMTAYGDLKLAVEAMKVGAADFVVKPWENEKFQATIQAAYNHSQSKKELTQLQNKQNRFNELMSSPDPLIGESEQMKAIYTTIEKVAGTDANILIFGENGTGKEVVAKAIHQHSTRMKQAFVKVDLGAIAESLFESELFGHKKGAFTDAKEERKGRFELADQGTLFLDEIGNLSIAMQAKLLTAIQSKQVVPVGGNEQVPVDCRIITATNENLSQLIHDKRFREDLLYRLNTVEIIIPPLRDRKADIPLLANHFLNEFNQKYRKQIQLKTGTYDYLCGHSWPGNIRELQHAIERAVIMADGDELGPKDFLIKAGSTKIPQDTLKLEELEKAAIEEAIKKNKGNMSQAAKDLGLGRTTLYRKMEKYGI